MSKKIILSVFIGILFLGLAGILLNGPYFWKVWTNSWSKDDRQHQSTNSTGDISEQRRSEPNTLIVPSLNITAPIVKPQESTEKSYQEALQNGVAHFPGTAEVGEVGNAYIFGHSSDMLLAPGSFKTIFALLPQIEIGAEILVSNNNGEQFRYLVTEKFVVENNQTEVLSQDTNGKQVLTLQTSYPLGTALKRFIVKSELSK